MAKRPTARSLQGRPGRRSWTCALAVAAALASGGLFGGSVASAREEPELVQPVLQNSASIDYPASLLDADPRPEGRVVVKFVVGVDGVPKELSISEGVHPELDALALEAVRKLRYKPATYGGQPVELVMSVGIDIVAPAPPPEPPPEQAKPDDEATSTPGERAVADEGPVRLRGRLREAGRRNPVPGAAVLVVPADPELPVGQITRKIYGEDDTTPAWSVRVFTDDDGRFEVRGIPDGHARVIVLAQGYERLDYVEDIAAGKLLEVDYFQQRLVTNPYRTTVTSQRSEPEEVARRSISVEEINNLPGTQGDALKSIQNFPGVARAPFGIGLLVIRGSAPSDSNTYLGYHRIPQLFHFGAISSVFNSDMLAQIDYIPGNFDSRYGDAIGGIINVAPRKGRRDGFHGYIDSDVFDIGALVEGPVGKGSYALSARRSYIDALLPAVLPDDAGLTLTQAPRYWDYQALFDYPLGGGEFSVRIFGSDDRLEAINQDANEVQTDSRNEAGTAILFHRADLVYRKVDGPWEFLITPSYRYDQVSANAGGVFDFTFFVHNFSGRAEITRWFSRRYSLRVGAEVVAGQYDIDAQAPSFPAGSGLGSTDVLNIGEFNGPFVNPAIYSTATIGLHQKFTLFPGVRVHGYGIEVNRVAVDPRLRFLWQVADKTQIKGGFGQFTQGPEITQIARIWGNPDLWLERALHTSLGVAQQLPYGMNLEVTGFYKHVWDRITASDTILRDPELGARLENWANQGIGHIFGAEILFRKDLTDRLFGWVSYTVSRSVERAKPGDPFLLFGFDQTHILTALAVYKLPRNWQIGARFRLVSGNPYTARTAGVFNGEDGTYLPLDGPIRGERLPAFHQLDLRVDKRWVLRRVMMNLYLDVQNIYNHQNPEAVNYSYDWRDRQYTTGLPIIPSLGFRFSW
ncbi:MAG: TonB family protein [Nannocystaceae bacterium]